MPYAKPSQALRRAIRRERPWIFTGAVALAGLAGFVNVVVLGYFQVPVSHMSGAVSRLSIDVAGRDFVDLKLVLGIIGGFLAGAVLSGVLIGGSQLLPGRRYGAALCLEGGLLALATLLLARQHSLGVPLAAMACGVQNGMASSYLGLTIRTTHVTGIVTDLGVMLGHWVRERRVQGWKLLLLLTLLLGFLLGGTAGALALARLGMWALSLASAGAFLAGVAYLVWLHRRRAAAHAPLDLRTREANI
jgi:uncharacterized membrane protein YoaK (UPF0700 family)